MPRSRWLTIALLAAATPSGAQDSIPSRTITQMIIGAGMPFAQLTRWTPAYAVGFEVTPTRSSTSIRLTGEYGENTDDRGDYYAHQRIVGVQAVGIRHFRTGRVQPYLLAGAGLYSVDASSMGPTWLETDSGFNPTGPIRFSRSSRTIPTLIWGTGMNLRVRRTTLFAELKLPFYTGQFLQYGPQSPLIVGFKF